MRFIAETIYILPSTCNSCDLRVLTSSKWAYKSLGSIQIDRRQKICGDRPADYYLVAATMLKGIYMQVNNDEVN